MREHGDGQAQDRRPRPVVHVDAPADEDAFVAEGVGGDVEMAL